MSHTDFWIIRHGETDWNAERRLQGWRDIPLNPNGIAQAEALNAHLQERFSDAGPEHIYTSDLQRAYHTALPYARSCDKPVQRLPGLRERNYGILEGQLWSALAGFDSAHTHNLAIELDPNEHKAEDLATFYTRIRQTLNTLAQKHRNETVMIVSHGGAIDMMWRAAGNLAPNAPRQFSQRNTSINRLRIISDDSWQIVSWADTSHLPQVVTE
ncbi:histidine phosphatase family protein [Advenella mimigardefordensis]|uniref:Putative phosphoglycerate mutase n=1 Tax=Advenella mimigardefordensis (strain DSM 17166 / LMG 22922 / DPN7) TaxID=1247726 RepID=W0PGZ9_ADVMD|nr:histidine phosphatase family protein [Advenella mimigardefordensis]AHG64675.1 putative phosphoglycerate mutase [Advenella mimigardefordensis DPN7]